MACRRQRIRRKETAKEQCCRARIARDQQRLLRSSTDCRTSVGDPQCLDTAAGDWLDRKHECCSVVQPRASSHKLVPMKQAIACMSDVLLGIQTWGHPLVAKSRYHKPGEQLCIFISLAIRQAVLPLCPFHHICLSSLTPGRPHERSSHYHSCPLSRCSGSDHLPRTAA
jgi:hypothetical protein